MTNFFHARRPNDSWSCLSEILVRIHGMGGIDQQIKLLNN